ncbi:TonB-dependent receptor [Tunicatimonas pelagia]|uniref:TonB-dependent receptor n=1 Tax=Tunicatimonas pelagia TaxID=931531 RepID=UPI002666CB7E|nr:TonB-dependent receptor [Tunicatimonas pelagia]WKN45616.1 TonB-dependent receptor [Tunicatimonas pelagia]
MNQLLHRSSHHFACLLCGVVLILGATTEAWASSARSIREVKVSLNLTNVTLEEALLRIENQTEFRFVYSSQNVDKDQLVNLKVYDVSVANVLETLFQGKNLIVRQRNHQIMIKGYHRAPRPKIVVVQEYGAVIGTITDEETGEGLAGATIIVKGTNVGTTADIDGDYLLVNVPEGKQTIVYQFIGFDAKEIEVDIEARAATNVDVELKPEAILTQEVIITGQALGQQAAINRQISSNTIVNIVSKERIEELPDQNAAESVGRLPGIAIQRNAGEGQKVVVRGLSPRFNAITINGERIPSTDPSDRSVDLSMIAPEQLAGIEVFKALTPDKDGDAIGGTVNFVAKKADAGLNGDIRASGGYNSVANEWGQPRVNASLSNRFLNNKLGVLITGNYQQANRSSDVLQTDWDNNADTRQLNLAAKRVSDINEVRRRYGGSLGLDYDLGASGNILFNALWGETVRNEIRRRRQISVASNFQNYDIRDRKLRTRLISNTLSGEHRLFDKTWAFNWRASYSLTRQTTPFSHELGFREESALDASQIPIGGFQDGTTFQELESIAFNRTGEAYLRRGGARLREDETDEDIYTLQLDLQKDFRIGSNVAGFIKGGVKARYFDRVKDAIEFRDNGNGPEDGFAALINDFPNEYTRVPQFAQIAMTNFLEDSYDAGDFLDGDINFGPGINVREANRLADWFSDDYYFRRILIDNEDYEARELVSAGYLMSEVNIGNLMLLGGVRIERTDADYRGFETFQQDDDQLGEGEVGQAIVRDSLNSISYTEILPMFQAKYQITDWFDIRGALTKSLARPNFQNLVPWRAVNRFEAEARLGNPGLQHMTAWNYDVFFSFYNKFGLFTVGAFYKELQNVDVQSTFNETDRRDEFFGFEVEQPINVTSTTEVRGVEIDIQANFRMLPAPFDGIVLSANATLIDSRTFYPLFAILDEREAPFFYPTALDTERLGSIPGQPDLTFNASLGYEKGGFSGRVSVIVQDNSFDELGSNETFDTFTGLLTRWDATASQKITPRWQVYANWNNITDAPPTSFLLDERFESEREFFGATFDLGIRYRFSVE